MPIYEALTGQDYVKIAGFVAKQPETSIPFICWQRGFKGEGLLVDSIQRLKEQMPYLHIFWIEDNGEIRAVISFHERMSIEKVPIVTYAFVCVTEEDWKNNNGSYFKELIDWLIRNKWNEYGVERGEFFGVEKYALWTKELCGDSMEVLGKDYALDLGEIVYAYTIDFKKYVGTR